MTEKGMAVISIHKNRKIVWNDWGIPKLGIETKDSECRKKDVEYKQERGLRLWIMW